VGIKGYAHRVYNGTMIGPLRQLSFPVIKYFELDDFQFLSFTGKNVTTVQPQLYCRSSFLGESLVQGEDFLRFMLRILIRRVFDFVKSQRTDIGEKKACCSGKWLATSWSYVRVNTLDLAALLSL
jgi:hypothetical protein